jgi:hypothetical protein
MASAGSWTEADFERMSWHDTHVHGLQIEGGGQNGTGTFALDLDYIVEWLPPIEGAFQFRLAPATLIFYDVFALKIDLNWVGAAMTPFSMSSIGRKKLAHDSWAWSIGVNWPEGFITFESTRFTQVLRAPLITKSEQYLEPEERLSRIAV